MDDDVPQDDAALTGLLRDLDELSVQARRGPEAVWTDAAKLAGERVFNRFRRRIYAYVKRRIVSQVGAAVPIDQFVSDLFLKFVKAADKFKPKNVHSLDNIEAQFLFTIHTYAGWLVKDYLRESLQGLEAVTTLTGDLATFRAAGTPQPSDSQLARLHALEQALMKLDECDCDVVLTSCRFYDTDAQRFMVPDDLRQALRQRWDMSDNGIAQCRKRALTRLQKLFQLAA